ncbi:MAG: MBL fold metallo-hydrolase [Acidobacteria bacterium]|nr:MBL fold metallo-hydrolase [Acidobacteriota bacterium]
MIGCKCETCISTDERDRRLRASILIEHNGFYIVIDTSTDFRQQALRLGLDSVDAIFITHCHADHVFGLDDIRPINFRTGKAISCFASERTWRDIHQVFSYIFRPSGYEGLPKLIPNRIEGAFELFGMRVEPLEVIHGRLPVTAFRFNTEKSWAYVIDCNVIPDETLAQLKDLDLLIIDSLRYREHPTHLNLEKTLKYIEELKPKQTLLTHMSHDFRHNLLSGQLPEHISPAFDGLQIEI